MSSRLPPLLLILSINAMSQIEMGNVTCNESVSSPRIATGAYHYWTLDLTQEYLVTFDDCSTNFDSTLIIFDNHTDISSATYCPFGNDCGICSNNSLGQIFTMPLPIGTYRIQMDRKEEDRGEYEINVQCNKISPLDTIQCNSTINGLVEMYDVHYYQWIVEDTISMLYIESNINDCDIRTNNLVILDEDYIDITDSIYCNGNSMEIQNLSAGTYYVAISPLQNQMDRKYQIELQCQDTIQFLKTIDDAVSTQFISTTNILPSTTDILQTTPLPTIDPTEYPTNVPTTAVPTFEPTTAAPFHPSLTLCADCKSQNTTNTSNYHMHSDPDSPIIPASNKQSFLMGLDKEYIIFISLITAICCATACFMGGLVIKLKRDKLRKQVMSCDAESYPKGHSPPWNNVYSIELTTTNENGEILTVPITAVNTQSSSNHAAVNSVSTPISTNSSQEIMNFDITLIQTNSTPITENKEENDDLYTTYNTIQFRDSDDKHLKNKISNISNLSDEVREHAYSLKHKLPSLPPESLANLDNVLMDKNSIDILQPIVEQDTFSASPPLQPKSGHDAANQSVADIKQPEPSPEAHCEEIKSVEVKINVKAERDESLPEIVGVGIPRKSQLLPPATPGDQFEDGDFEHYEGDGEDMDRDDVKVDIKEDILGPMPVIKNPMITIGNTPNGVSVESNDVEMEFLEKVFKNPDLSPSLLAMKGSSTTTGGGPIGGCGYGQSKSNDTDEEFDSNTHEL